jgi:hypothetical protein
MNIFEICLIIIVIIALLWMLLDGGDVVGTIIMIINQRTIKHSEEA